MTDNTPLNADDELRNRIYNEVKRWMTPNESLRFIDDFMPIILADRKKHELQARIDEVYRLDGGDEDWQLYHDERIAELRNQIQDKENK